MIDNFGRKLPTGTDPDGSIYTIVSAQNVGFSYRAIISEREGSATCESTLEIVDFNAPRIQTVDTTLSIFAELDPNRNPALMAQVDDCSEYSIVFSDSLAFLPCDSAAYAKTYRTWIATDEGGFVNRVQQILTQNRPDFRAFTAPNDTILDCSIGSVEEVSYGTLEIETLGQLYELGTLDGEYGNLFWYHTDETFTGFGGRRTVLRTWRLFDDCQPFEQGSNPRTLTQRITLADTTAPSIGVPFDTLFFATGPNCQASGDIPTVLVADNCTQNPSVTFSLDGRTYSSNGGSVEGLPLGTHVLIYRARDGANNVGEASALVVVNDYSPPVLSTPAALRTSIALSGVTRIPADAFSGGSSDECGPTTITVKRADEETFGPSVELTCADVGNPVDVEVRATDRYDNSNWRTVLVYVDDLAAPHLTAPENQSVPCSANLTKFDRFGQPAVQEACSYTLQDSVAIDIDSCRTGTITRFWTATDASGHVGSTSQLITVYHEASFDESNILWPVDTIFSACSEIPRPEELSATTGFPRVDSVSCTRIQIQFDDEVFRPVGGGCALVYRTWNVRDACSSTLEGDQVFQHLQRIRMVDDEPPTFPMLQDSLNLYADVQSCTTVQFDLGQLRARDCNLELRQDIELDLYGDGVVDSLFDASLDHVELPLGRHIFTTSAVDGCRNSATKSLTVLALDTFQVRALCLDTLRMVFDTTVKQLDPRLLLRESPSLCLEPNVQLAKPFKLSCDWLGSTDVTVLVNTSRGDSATCESVIELVDSTDVCRPPTRGVTLNFLGLSEGKLTPTLEVKPSLSGTAIDTYAPRDTQVVAVDVPLDTPVYITAHTDDAVLRGVNVYDILLMSRHLLGLSELPFKSVVAGDVDGSGSMNSYDITLIRRVLLRRSSRFSALGSYRYVFGPPSLDVYEQLADVPDSHAYITPEDSSTFDVEVIKLGDVSAHLPDNARGQLNARSKQEFEVVIKQTGTRGTVTYAGSEPLDLYALNMRLPALSIALGSSLKGNLLSNAAGQFTYVDYLLANGETIEPGQVLFEFERALHQLDRATLLIGTVVAEPRGQIPQGIRTIKSTITAETLTQRRPKVVPNPVRSGSTVLVEVDGNGPEWVELVDARGVRLLWEEWQGRGHKTLVPSTLSAGMYYIRIGFADGQTSSQRIHVSH